MRKMLFFCVFSAFISIFINFFAIKLQSYAFFQSNEIIIELLNDNQKYTYFSQNYNKMSHTFEEQYLLDQSIITKSKKERIAFVEKCVSLGIGYEMAMESFLPQLRRDIDALDKKYFIQVKNASFEFDATEAEPFVISPSVRGQKLDREKLFLNIFERYKKGDHINVRLPFIYTEPLVTTQQVKKLTSLRSSFSTNYSSSSADRKHNVKMALSGFNGLVVQPAEKVSFNDIVGRRTPENGYRTAKIILDGEYVDGVGGGVCQASTTLYNAILLADLQVNEAHRHSRRVSYVPPALDAMVNWSSSDMVFTNTTTEPIYITTSCDANSARVNIYGLALPAGLHIATKSEIVKTTPPPEEEIIVDRTGEYADKVFYDDESFYIHKAKDGVLAKSYLIKTLNGKQISKQLIRTEQYPPERATKIIGANPRPAEYENNWEDYLTSIFGW